MYKLRPAASAAEDLEAIRLFGHGLYGFPLEKLAELRTREDLADLGLRMAKREGHTIVVVDGHNKIAGAARITPSPTGTRDPWTGEIEHWETVAIHPDHRGRGLSYPVRKAALDTSDAVVIKSRIKDDNPKSWKVAEQLGFKLCDRDGSERIYVMRRPHLKKVAVQIADDATWASDPLAYTAGRIEGAPMAALVGTTAPFRRGATGADVADIAKYMDEGGANDAAPRKKRRHPVLDYILGNASRPDELVVFANRNAPIDKIKRLWTRRDISLLSRLLGTVATPLSMIDTSLRRADHYDPLSHSVTIYNNDPAIIAHELGHGEDFTRRRKWMLPYAMLSSLPFAGHLATLGQEGAASKNALRMLGQKMEREKRLTRTGKFLQDPKARDAAMRSVNRKLTGAFGTYVGAPLGPLGSIAGAAMGQAVGQTATPFTDLAEDDPDVKKLAPIHRWIEPDKAKPKRKMRSKAKPKRMRKVAFSYLDPAILGVGGAGIGAGLGALNDDGEGSSLAERTGDGAITGGLTGVGALLGSAIGSRFNNPASTSVLSPGGLGGVGGGLLGYYLGQVAKRRRIAKKYGRRTVPFSP